jgi:hypothetical protein
MCRFGDVGPYALGNIYIDTLANNVSHARKLEQEKKCVWVSTATE